MTELKLTNIWDKVFPKSENVCHEKVSFKNRYGIELAADLYKPLDNDSKLPAIACSGPFGAVKEQVSGLYAQKLAEMGFLTMHLIHHLQVKAEANHASWRLRISTLKISRLQ